MELNLNKEKRWQFDCYSSRGFGILAGILSKYGVKCGTMDRYAFLQWGGNHSQWWLGFCMDDRDGELFFAENKRTNKYITVDLSKFKTYLEGI